MPKWKPDETVSAYFSPCGAYRYWLGVEWSEARPTIVVIGLNPSKADLERDDNTIRKCVNWAKAHGYGALLMLNCFAFRATDPKDMKAAADPFGEQTTVYLAGLCIGKTTVAAWGGNAKHLNRGRDVALELRAAGVPLYCLGINQDGSPLHPCYASMPETLTPWETARSGPDCRYSPAEVAATEVVQVMGDPDPERICTSIVERSNLSLRMGLRRFTRLTNAFSKKWENHWAAVALWFTFYNFCRIHKSLRITPAMAAGIADHVWAVRELLEFS